MYYVCIDFAGLMLELYTYTSSRQLNSKCSGLGSIDLNYSVSHMLTDGAIGPLHVCCAAVVLSLNITRLS